MVLDSLKQTQLLIAHNSYDSVAIYCAKLATAQFIYIKFIQLKTKPALMEILLSFTVCSDRGEQFYSCFTNCVHATVSDLHILKPSSWFIAEILCAEGARTKRSKS